VALRPLHQNLFELLHSMVQSRARLDIVVEFSYSRVPKKSRLQEAKAFFALIGSSLIGGFA
jgi:hypothetical protein